MVGYFLQGKSRLQKKKLDNIFFPKQRYVEGDEKKREKKKGKKSYKQDKNLVDVETRLERCSGIDRSKL